MRLRRFFQRITLIDLNFHIAIGNHFEKRTSGLFKFLAGGCVGHQRGPRDVKRATACQFAKTEV